MSRKHKGNVRRWASAQKFLRITNSPVLKFENVEDFDQLRRALEYDFDPQGTIQEIYLSDIADLVWEILRLRACKKEVLNRQYLDKLFKLVEEKCKPIDEPEKYPGEAYAKCLEMTGNRRTTSAGYRSL